MVGLWYCHPYPVDAYRHPRHYVGLLRPAYALRTQGIAQLDWTANEVAAKPGWVWPVLCVRPSVLQTLK